LLAAVIDRDVKDFRQAHDPRAIPVAIDLHADDASAADLVITPSLRDAIVR